MPQLPAASGVIRAVLQVRLDNQICNNVMHFTGPDGGAAGGFARAGATPGGMVEPAHQTNGTQYVPDDCCHRNGPYRER